MPAKPGPMTPSIPNGSPVSMVLPVITRPQAPGRGNHSLEAGQRQHVRLSPGCPRRSLHTRRRLRFYLAPGIRRFHQREFHHHGTCRPELESAVALSAGRAARLIPISSHADGSQRLALRHRAADPARKRQPDRVPARLAHHHGGFPRLCRRPLQDVRVGRRSWNSRPSASGWSSPP